MFVVGSHYGSEDDGYVTSTGGTRFWNAYRKRPQDFKRRIIERVHEGDIAALRAVEQRWLDFIKAGELGVRYYNINKTANGFDYDLSVKGGRIGGLLGGPITSKKLHKEKLPDGRSIHAVKLGAAAHVKKLPDGRSVTGVKGGTIGGKMSNAEKLPDGRSVHAVKMGQASNAEKLPDGRSVTAVKAGTAARSEKLPDGRSVNAVKYALISHEEKLPDGRSIHAVAMGKASALARKNRKLAENLNPPQLFDRSASQTLEILQTAQEGSGPASAEP